MTKVDDLVAALKKHDEEKKKNTALWVFAIIGVVTAIAAIAYAVYRYFAPDYLEDFEDDFDDDFEDFFEDDDFPEAKSVKKAEEKEEESAEEGEKDESQDAAPADDSFEAEETPATTEDAAGAADEDAQEKDA